MTQQQKVSVIALGVFAIAAITLGLLHVNQGLVGAVAWKPKAKTVEQTQKKKEDTLADLQSKDTDGDGLNDYEELNVFTTSPYLTDTDGDNLDDAKEIQSGKDPNCPEGKTCSTSQDKIAGEELIGQGGVSIADTAAGTPPQNLEAQQQLQALLSGENVDPVMIRELLKQGGIGEDILQKIDDATLLKIYDDVLKQFNESGAAGLPGGGLDAQTLQQLSDLSIDMGQPQTPQEAISE